MIQLIRSFVVGIFLAAGGIVSVALLEKALEYLAPDFSYRPVGFTNVSTIVQGVAVLVIFFACGLYGPRWMKSRAPGFWLLLPLASLYAVAILLAPDVYRIHGDAIGGTLFIHSPFLMPILATAVGYACFRARHAASLVV
jgi:hypothetical protein